MTLNPRLSMLTQIVVDEDKEDEEEAGPWTITLEPKLESQKQIVVDEEEEEEEPDEDEES